MPLNVFVVEDSWKVRTIMEEQISDLPNVVCAGHADGEPSALEHLFATVCDVLILDIKLKTGTGLGVLRALTATDWLRPPRTRIIFSNYADPAFRTLAMRLGATHFFDKKQDFPALLALVSDLALSTH
jgi:DNA-binding NarL/FixJ family response regulator